MNCPLCGTFSGVVDTRKRAGYTYRRRECGACAHRFTTHETVADGRPAAVEPAPRSAAADGFLGWRAVQLYEALQCWQATRPYPPTLAELGAACGLTTTPVKHHLDRLLARGLVTWEYRKSRTLRVAR